MQYKFVFGKSNWQNLIFFTINMIQRKKLLSISDINTNVKTMLDALPHADIILLEGVLWKIFSYWLRLQMTDRPPSCLFGCAYAMIFLSHNNFLPYSRLYLVRHSAIKNDPYKFQEKHRQDQGNKHNITKAFDFTWTLISLSPSIAISLKTVVSTSNHLSKCLVEKINAAIILTVCKKYYYYASDLERGKILSTACSVVSSSSSWE